MFGFTPQPSCADGALRRPHRRGGCHGLIDGGLPHPAPNRYTFLTWHHIDRLLYLCNDLYGGDKAGW
jgi:hypothetical protein